MKKILIKWLSSVIIIVILLSILGMCKRSPILTDKEKEKIERHINNQ
ncbi:hypothetical protein P4485_02045 [Bacillus thuringiensis]|nr:hypothetical protein [Bacillus thuringiensis]